MTFRHLLVGISLLTLIVSPAFGQAAPAIGEWDGVTESAKLAGPYEDPVQATVPFGIISYFVMPWRSYMDTWPASKYLEVPGANWNIDDKYAEPVCQLMQESGIKYMRFEEGWSNMQWDDTLNQGQADRMHKLFAIFQKHGIRPLILLNAHHGVPCPIHYFDTALSQPAKKGDRVVHFPAGTKLRVGYTGFNNLTDYVAAYPMITQIGDDGTAQLSAPLPKDLPAGKINLEELKYQPLQGPKLKDGTLVPASQETLDGWLKYVKAVASAARDALGTQGKADAGFDLEVWNEQTFGANFLDINNYYDPHREYAEGLKYTKTRPRLASYRPDAQTDFSVSGYTLLLPMTIDWIKDPANGFPGVNVISGFSNQWPWDNGAALWDGQAGFSRHYYTGGWQDSSPDHQIGQVNSGVIDALGQFEGKHDNKDWHTIILGTKFVPTFRVGMPEFLHTGFKTESLSRDVLPDSRLVGFGGHGRYTHNGDYHTAQLWETEVNYYRRPFFDQLFTATGAKQDDPRALALDQHMNGKMMLRQYIFHAHKGLHRLMIFALGPDSYSFGMLPPAFYTALDKSNDILTPAVRATVTPAYKGLAWINRLMLTGQSLTAPRPLRVDSLTEYKPRLVFAGDGAPNHPNRYNRDEFAVMPFQLDAHRYAIPYYVVTLDVTHVWDKAKDPLDPARYDMPPQDFDVTLGNIRGKGAVVSAYDPLSNLSVPVSIAASTPSTLTVRLHAVDYPRILQVTEALLGPQILDPQAKLGTDGRVHVSWHTNLPVTASLTYGHDWTNRGVSLIQMAGGKTNYAVTLPAGLTGVVASRIKVSANGLSDVWPRWDEDPQGQVVVPGEAAPTHGQTLAPPLVTGLLPDIKVAPGTPLTMPASVTLTQTETNAAHNYSLRLPSGVTLSGTPDNREAMVGMGDNTVTLNVRYLGGGVKSYTDALPTVSTIDKVEREVVTGAGWRGVRFQYALAAAAHPGQTNLRQMFLLVPLGQNGGDLFVISATGTPEAMQANAKRIAAIFASVTVTK